MADRGVAVRALIAGAVGLIVGLGLGGLAPRAELRALEDKVATLEDQKDCKGSGLGRELASAFRGRPLEAALEEDEVEAIDRARDKPEPEPQNDDEDGFHMEFNVGDGEQPSPETVEQGLQMAKDAMAMRQAQARAALDDQVQPTEEQWDAIDGALDQMNGDLKSLAQEFAGTIAEGQEPSRREAMLFAADTLDVLLAADDAIWDSLTDDQRAAADPETLDPMSHINPDLLDAFLELDR